MILAMMVATFAVQGCALENRRAHAEAMAATAGMKRLRLETSPFILTAFVRITDPNHPITIYMEGDGLAWLSRSVASPDPTPAKATGLALAVADITPNVAYLARPCQFTDLASNPQCHPSWWTGKRFAPEVVASINQALDQIAAIAPGQKLELVGYSGGGAIAILVAARRTDVTAIKTVAGNLDHDAVNHLADVSPLAGSLNAIDYASQTSAIPQIHYSGRLDRIVPPAIARRYADAANFDCIRLITVDGVGHEDGWAEHWPALSQAPGICAAPDRTTPPLQP